MNSSAIVGRVSDERGDLIELSDEAWRRLLDRLAGLTDDEYLWEPVADCRTVRPSGDGTFRSDGPARRGDPRVFTTLSWRCAHIADFLTEERNASWLHQPVLAATRTGDPGTAAEAMAALTDAYAMWRTVLTGVTSDELALPVGPLAGPYADATRRSFVLHVLDELIHHAAEVALLRDLYQARA